MRAEEAPVTELSVLELSRRLQAKELSSVEVTEAYLARISQMNPELNAYLSVAADLALEIAEQRDRAASRGERRGPLDGLPLGLKNNFALAGHPMTVGSGSRRGDQAGADSEVAKRL